MKKQYLYTAIGAVAFVVGGIVTRAKAIEMAETVENTFTKKDKPSTPVPDLRADDK